MVRKRILLLLVLGSLALTYGVWRVTEAPSRDAVLEWAGATMGTGYSVKIPARQAADLSALANRIEVELERINQLMSTWREDSELSRFNRSQAQDWFPLSADTHRVIAVALEVGQLTGGALDVTVGPLVALWGFGPGTPIDERPSEAQVRLALARCGMDQISLRANPPAIRKSHPRLEIDLSAIAKGYAVDRIADLLESEGVSAFLVDIGGEIRAGGSRAPGQPWRVAVEKPAPGQRSIQQVIEIHDQGLATSGDYRNYFEVDGQRYSHVIDPSTGFPVPQSVASVSVLAGTAMEADALATAFMVMGVESTLAFADAQGLAVLVIERVNGGFRERPSRTWPGR